MSFYGQQVNFEEFDITIEASLFDDVFDQEMTADEVKIICDAIQNKYKYLNENFILTEAMNPEGPLRRFCTAFKIPFSVANGSIKKCGSSIVNSIKKNGINKTSRAEISRAMDQCSQEFSEAFGTYNLQSNIREYARQNNTHDSSKIVRAIYALIKVMIINSLLQIILIALFGPYIGVTLTATIVAPIVEETAKQKSIRYGYDKEFFLIFNAYEMSTYVLNITKGEIKFKDAIILRTKTVMLHLTTTIIQKILVSKKVMEFFKMNPENDDDKRNMSFIGKIIGIIVHAGWNFASIFNGGENMVGNKIFGKQKELQALNKQGIDQLKLQAQSRKLKKLSIN